MGGCMDNDYKVVAGEDTERNKVQLFLSNSLKSIRRDTPISYDLEYEFGRTKQNKDYLAISIIASVAILIIAVSGIVTAFINRSSRNVAVDITVFEDLNLKNVLDLAKKAEDNLDSVLQKRIARQSLFQDELANLELQYRSEIEVLGVQRLSNSERSAKRTLVDNTYAGLRNNLKSSYDSDMASLDLALEDAKKQVESFDKKRVEEAREQKKLLDNQQDVFELEKQRIKDGYGKEIETLRVRMEEIQNENARLKTDQIKTLVEEYQTHIAAIDPDWDDLTADAYINEIAAYPDASLPFRSIPELPPSVDGISAEDFSLMARGYEGLGYLLSRVAGIGFEHDVDDYVKAGLKIALVAGAAGERIIGTSFDALERTRNDLVSEQAAKARAEKELDQAQHALSEAQRMLKAAQETENRYLELKVSHEQLVNSHANLARKQELTQDALDIAYNALISYESMLVQAVRQNGHDGVVFSAANPLSPGIFVLPEIEETAFATGSATAYLYHPPKTLIGEILLSGSENGVAAVVSVTLKRGKDLLPFDYISFTKR